MTYQEMKMIMRSNARLVKGLVNLLVDDADQMCIDTEDFDLFSLEEAVFEGKRTAQNLLSTIDELERNLLLAKRNA
jgi:hypothetical protein